MLSGSLASPRPPDGGKPEERGDEETETQSRGHLQGSGGLGATCQCVPSAVSLISMFHVSIFLSRPIRGMASWSVMWERVSRLITGSEPWEMIDEESEAAS